MGFPHPAFYFNEYFTPYFKYQIAENAKPCKKTQYLLNIFQRKVACIKYMLRFRKTAKNYTIGVY